MLGLGFYLILLIIGLTASLFIRIRFEVTYTRRSENDHLKVLMSVLGGLIRYRTEVPIMDLDSHFLKPILKMEADIENVASDAIEDKGLVVKMPVVTMLQNLPAYLIQGLTLLNKYKRALKRLLKTIRCHDLVWRTEIGLQDPANTGVATGMVWAAKGFLFRMFRSNVGKMLNPPTFSVIPSFNCPCLRLDFNCIFDMRIGHIIIAGLQIVKLRYRP